jgi:CubicO group peptidase (beta-lactamase class C family)
MKCHIPTLLGFALITLGCAPEPRDEHSPTPTSAGLEGSDGDGDGEGDTASDDGTADAGGTTFDDADGSTGAPPVDFDPAFVIAQAQAALAAGAPGLAVAVVMDGQVVFAEGFGVADESGTPVDPDTLFNLASITKGITALTVLSQRDEGLLSLDTPVPAIIPGFALRDGFDPASVQVGHLLTHSAGLGDWPTEPYVPSDTLLEEFTLNPNQPLWFSSGAVFDYSNRGFSLAGLVAATVDGSSFDTAGTTRVLVPLGMTGATLEGALAAERSHARGLSSDGWWGPQDYAGEWLGPSGGLWAGAQDLGRYVQAIATGEGGGLDEALADATGPVMPLHLWPGQYYGYGLFVDIGYDPAVVSHGGSIGGYLSDMQVIPELGFGVIAVANTDLYWPGELTYAVAEHYVGQLGFSDAPDTAALFASIPGTYVDPWQLGSITVSEAGGGLSASFADFGQTVPLTEWGGGSFSFPHPLDGFDTELMFWPDAAGNASSFVTRAGVAARQ